MTIMLYKLSTGEEVIGASAPMVGALPHAATVDIGKPLIVVRQFAQDGTFGVQLIPYFSAALDTEITVDQQHIVAMVRPSKGLEDAYLQQTSGILLGGMRRPQ